MSFDYRTSRWALAGGLLMILSGALGVGCGGEDPIQPFPYPTEQSFCDTLAQVQCSQQVVTACYGSDASSLSQDTEACVKAASRSSHCNPKGLDYHPETANDCLLMQKTVYSDADVTALELKDLTETCIAVFNAGGGSGDGCNVDSDCDTGADLRCVIKTGNAGQCFKPHFVSGGSKCTDKADQCNSGFYCDEGGHCVENPATGEACDVGKPCKENAFCSANVCVAKSPNGAACTADEECKGSGGGGFCIAGSNGTDGNCASTWKLQLTSSNCDEFR